MINLKNKTALLLSLFLLSPLVAKAGFTDVKTDNPHYDAIKYLQDEKMINGYADGTFRPDQEISRAEFVKLIFNQVGYKAPDRAYETKFTDVPPNSWFAPYVAKCLELQAISINPSVPLFYPAAPISKVDALKIIMPVEGIPAPFIDNATPIIFSDVSGNASYAYLVKAAENAGLFTSEDGAILRPFKNLTRGEAAELLYRAGAYNGAIYTGTIDVTPYLSQSDADLINNPKFPIFLDIWTRINNEYVDKNKLDQNDLILSAISGMVDSLGDQYSIFEKPAESQSMQNSLSGNFEGIGVTLQTVDNSLTITSVLKDSPAEKAGLKAGDTITSVDGKSIKGKPVNEVVTMIQGPAGTQVTLVISRNSKSYTYKIKREKLTMDSVSAEDTITAVKIPDDIGYIAIYQFTDSTGTAFSNTYEAAMAKKPKGLILDLRDNPGGYLDTAYEVLGHFIENGKTMAILKSASESLLQSSNGDADFPSAKIPLIVLVNGGTASAAEVIAGAIQDYKIGKLLGVKTYGKGTVQAVTTYSDQSMLKLSIAHWLTPLGHDINKIGLTPDITLAETADDKSGKTDTQLQKAIAELGK